MSTYSDEMNVRNITKLRAMLEEMPPFCTDYFRGISTSTSANTRTGYCRNIHTFLRFILERNPVYKGRKMQSLPIDMLEEITPMDIDEYVEYLDYYVIDGVEYRNDVSSKARNLSAISNMYRFFNKRKLVTNNPMNAIERPKIHDKNIITLDQEQIFDFMSVIENPEQMSDRQKKLHERTLDRDRAIITMFLGTGIRVSELVGLDISDIDFKNQSIRVLRKGGNEEFVFFGEDVAEALYYYLHAEDMGDGLSEKSARELLLKGNEEDERALFISLKGQRMAVRSVQEMVKRYQKLLNLNKKITPHKLRSTFGTALYNETGDIYLVADVLGHKDVNTTKKHYAAQSDENRKRAANIVQIKK